MFCSEKQFSELAEYYSTFRSSAKQAEIGRPIVLYVKNLDRGGLMSQQLLMTLGGVPRGGMVGQMFYAQSCATVHYLLHGNEQGKELQAKLTGDDEEMQQLADLLDAAAQYLEALRLAQATSAMSHSTP